MGEAAQILEEEIEIDDQNLACVRISEFYSPKVVLFDLYLKMGAGKYLKIFREGEMFNESVLRSYETDRGLRHVYFFKELRGLYVKSSLALFQKIVSLAAVPVKTKFGVARILSELYLQELYSCSEEARPDLLKKGIEICGHLAAWIETENSFEALILRQESVDASPEELAFLSGMLAGASSKRFNWKSRRTTEVILQTAFFCDVGLFALPPEISRLRPKRMKAAQREEYETHPDLSYAILKNSGVVPDQISNLVREHHEYCDGTGFPAKLTLNKIMQLTKLISIAADTIRGASELLLSPIDAAQNIFPNRSPKVFTEHPELVAKYDREMLLTFFDIFASVERG